jgi:hypothetical protein
MPSLFPGLGCLLRAFAGFGPLHRNFHLFSSAEEQKNDSRAEPLACVLQLTDILVSHVSTTTAY